jgi:hypothetical protein
MTSTERSLSSNTLNSPAWPRCFEEERTIELVRAACHVNDRYNIVGRRAWWLSRDVDVTL